MDDLISRQATIDAIGKLSDEIYRTVEKGATFPTREWFDGMAQAEHLVKNLPSVQSDAIPLEWIDKHLEWLDNCDNDFAQLARVSIRAMVEIWKKDKTR